MLKNNKNKTMKNKTMKNKNKYIKCYSFCKNDYVKNVKHEFKTIITN